MSEKKLILFQGDSITDAGRSRDMEEYMGHGYASMAAGRVGLKYPNEYTYLNRGISGNRIVDLYGRIKKDIINLKPDYLSILIGINGVLHEVAEKNGVDAEKFEKLYSMLLDEIKDALPDVKLIILEPFVLKTAEREECWDYYNTETRKRAEASKRIADKYGAAFVPLMDKFFELSKKAPETHWLMDGIHPTCAGHTFMADEWMKAFELIR